MRFSITTVALSLASLATMAMATDVATDRASSSSISSIEVISHHVPITPAVHRRLARLQARLYALEDSYDTLYRRMYNPGAVVSQWDSVHHRQGPVILRQADLDVIRHKHGHEMPAGLNTDQHVAAMIKEATSKGALVAYQNPGRPGGHPRPIYEFKYGGQVHHMAVSVHQQTGHVIGANMSSAREVQAYRDEAARLQRTGQLVGHPSGLNNGPRSPHW